MHPNFLFLKVYHFTSIFLFLLTKIPWDCIVWKSINSVTVTLIILRRYIHDEMYSVALDNAGNYLLLGGSGDEYDNYDVMGSGQWAGYSSNTWGSYLVVVDLSELLRHSIREQRGGVDHLRQNLGGHHGLHGLGLHRQRGLRVWLPQTVSCIVGE